jgi:phage terminase small subunit
VCGQKEGGILPQELNQERGRALVREKNQGEKELTEKQALFCFYYLWGHDAEKAARKAGYTAKNYGKRLLGEGRITEAVEHIKKRCGCSMEADAKKVLDMYTSIAFADIKEFIEIVDVQEEAGERKSAKDAGMQDRKENGQASCTARVQKADKRIILRLRDYEEIDGRLVEEMVSNSQGIRLKLPSRMKALEKLERYFDLFSEGRQRELEEKRRILEDKKEGNAVIRLITQVPRPQKEGEDGRKTGLSTD